MHFTKVLKILNGQFSFSPKSTEVDKGSTLIILYLPMTTKWFTYTPAYAHTISLQKLTSERKLITYNRTSRDEETRQRDLIGPTDKINTTGHASMLPECGWQDRKKNGVGRGHKKHELVVLTFKFDLIQNDPSVS
ncbi:hypothetical protein CHS0354_015688 [Potamilus streckersoni]|uniref:Uncharacterized protein n=1 Tax=Potamilus streckersoni TaxID=2493646 RepID=A0AAE0SRQ0_9BIVA|nr:hypothetical protein CHS0354_015688 [Potamilus streckersoni]